MLLRHAILDQGLSQPAALPCDHSTRSRGSEGGFIARLRARTGASLRRLTLFAATGIPPRSERQPVLLDWFSAGRTAAANVGAFKHLESRNDIFIGGERALVDSILLSSKNSQRRWAGSIASPRCCSSALQMKLAAEGLCATDRHPPCRKSAALTCSASPVSGGALLRVAGEEVETVRRELGGHLTFPRHPWRRSVGTEMVTE